METLEEQGVQELQAGTEPMEALDSQVLKDFLGLLGTQEHLACLALLARKVSTRTFVPHAKMFFAARSIISYLQTTIHHPPGSPGRDGSRGFTGAQGAPGAQGRNGAVGNTGSSGSPGATGPQGFAGQQGFNTHALNTCEFIFQCFF